MSINPDMKNRMFLEGNHGGQFAPAEGGQFESATHGQFKSAEGGQFDRSLQQTTGSKDSGVKKRRNPHLVDIECYI